MNLVVGEGSPPPSSENFLKIFEELLKRDMAESFFLAVRLVRVPSLSDSPIIFGVHVLIFYLSPLLTVLQFLFIILF